jgi:hypothetical protein
LLFSFGLLLCFVLFCFFFFFFFHLHVYQKDVNSDPSKYFFALKVENEFEDGDEAPGLIVKNISVTSTQQMAVSCQPSSRFTAVSCRFHASEGSVGGKNKCVFDS